MRFGKNWSNTLFVQVACNRVLKVYIQNGIEATPHCRSSVHLVFGKHVNDLKRSIGYQKQLKIKTYPTWTFFSKHVQKKRGKNEFDQLNYNGFISDSSNMRYKMKGAPYPECNKSHSRLFSNMTIWYIF